MIRIARVKLGDGGEMLVIPGVGVAMPATDAQGHPILGQLALCVLGYPPVPVRETFSSLEEKFGESANKLVLQ